MFRAKDAPFVEETDTVVVAPISAALQEAVGRLAAVGGAGEGSGSDTRLLFRLTGDDAVSLVHVWLKPNKPLPRHSHNVDCLYYVVSGEVRMGNQVLGPGDGFFVPAGNPYAYRVGPDGAEVLEFRPAATYDLQLWDERPENWDDYIDIAASNQEAWRAPSVPPSWR